MTTRAVDFHQFVADAEKRRTELGIPSDDASVDAMRNKGRSRSPAKRALLAAAAERARLTGSESVVSYVDGERVTAKSPLDEPRGPVDNEASAGTQTTREER